MNVKKTVHPKKSDAVEDIPGKNSTRHKEEIAERPR